MYAVYKQKNKMNLSRYLECRSVKKKLYNGDIIQKLNQDKMLNFKNNFFVSLLSKHVRKKTMPMQCLLVKKQK